MPLKKLVETVRHYVLVVVCGLVLLATVQLQLLNANMFYKMF